MNPKRASMETFNAICAQVMARGVSPGRAELALALEPLIAAKAKGKQREAGREKLPQKSAKAVDTREELARVAGVSHDTIAKAKVLARKVRGKTRRPVERKREILAAQATGRMKAGTRANPVPSLAQGGEAGKTRDLLAKEVGVSHTTYDKLRTVIQNGVPELVDAVRESRASAAAAAVIVELPEEQQQGSLLKGR